MRVYRTYHHDAESPGQTVPLDEDEAHHLASVRRASVGDEVLVLNGRGHEFRAVIREAAKRRAIIELTALAREAPAPPPLVLALALTKSPALEDILQRAVELGMTRLIPLVTERTVVDFDIRRAEKKIERWTRHGIEALKQCERLWLPRYDLPVSLGDFLNAAPADAPPVVLAERSPAAPTLATISQQFSTGISLLIGPEGGWSPAELETMRTHGIPAASLGTDTILRTETAALAALAIIQALRTP